MMPAPVPAIRGRKPMMTFVPSISKTQMIAHIVRRIAVSMSCPHRIRVVSRDRDLALLTSFALRSGPTLRRAPGRGDRCIRITLGDLEGPGAGAALYRPRLVRSSLRYNADHNQ